MVGHYSTIGFDVDSLDDMEGLGRRVLELGERYPVAKGWYVRWSCRSGAELWLQVLRRKRIIGLAPHFAGTSCIPVRLAHGFTRPQETPLDGAFCGWFDPDGGAPDEVDQPERIGRFVIVFDSPDFACHADTVLPQTVNLQLAAFAHEVTIHASPAELEAAREAGVAPHAYLPVGLLDDDGQPIDPPEAMAILTGQVLWAEKRVNELSGRTFHWAEVACLGGMVDMVIDPELDSTLPAPGHVIHGRFWLSGRLLGGERRPRGLVARLLGR